MGIFSKILGGVFGKKKQKQQEEKEAAITSQSAEATSAPEAAAAVEAAADAVTPEVTEEVDVDAVLSAKAAANSEKLDWKTSIVDLLKLLDIDSSYSARKELAAELGIAGYEGTAEQNVSMHKAVLNKLVANGGIVPAELLD